MNEFTTCKRSGKDIRGADGGQAKMPCEHRSLELRPKTSETVSSQLSSDVDDLRTYD